jgi:hypothetical protein
LFTQLKNSLLSKGCYTFDLAAIPKTLELFSEIIISRLDILTLVFFPSITHIKHKNILETDAKKMEKIMKEPYANHQVGPEIVSLVFLFPSSSMYRCDIFLSSKLPVLVII